jgi:2-amino-4-hydroxy-6-hydroxymethyldihydropteridine diphosphokinase
MGIYLGLGSNVGDRRAHLRFAVDALREKGITPWKSAAVYWTQPRDVEDQPWFLNTVIEVRTLLEPELLMRECLAIEQMARRVRDVPKGPRSLDIDILLYGDRIIEVPGLSIPHPRFRERRFVLVPLAELTPELPDPVSGLTMTQLLDFCLDEGVVRREGDGLL